MKLSKSQQRLLDKLRNTPAEDLTPEDLEDLEELEQLEKKEEETEGDDLSEIKKGLEEIKKCLLPKEITKQGEVEIPTPPPVVTNQEQEQDQEQPQQENKVVKFLKAIW